jgi:alkylation response protein AidB-like acyl-CoA dehydrogenase
VPDDATKLLDATRDLSPKITARSAEIESARELPRDLLDDLIAGGYFRMFVPRSHGGFEIDLPAGLRILETLARADGSTGWTVMIGAGGPLLFALLPRHRFDALYAHSPDLIMAGSFTPRGEASVIDGGFEVSGRWPFASGCLHSHWLVGQCIVTENGRPRPGPAPDSPETRLALFKRDQVKVIDTWHVAGLRGTGSHDIEVSKLRVSAEDTFDGFFGKSCLPGPLYLAAIPQFGLHVGSVGLGIAQHALDDIIALAGGQKRRLYAQTALADTPIFQHDLAHADASLRAARALLKSAAESFWSEVSAARRPTPLDWCQASSSASWVATTAARVVDFCYAAAGGTAVYDSSSLQRHLRDIHTLTQHIGVADGWLTRRGATLLGKDPGPGVA